MVVLFVMELRAHPGGVWLYSYCTMGTLVATSRLHAHLGRCGCTLKLLGTLISTFRLHVLGEGLHLQQQASPGKMSKKHSNFTLYQKPPSFMAFHFSGNHIFISYGELQW